MEQQIQAGTATAQPPLLHARCTSRPNRPAAKAGEMLQGPKYRAFNLERVTGIEPAQSAWEAETLPLSYTRVTDTRWTAILATAMSERTAARSGSVTCGPCCSAIVTSAPRSRPSGSSSTRGTPSWCSRPRSTSGSTASSGYSTTPSTPTSTRRMQQDELTTLVEPSRRRAVRAAPGRVRARLDPRGGDPARRPGQPARGQVLARPARPDHARHRRASSTPASPATSPWNCPTSPTCRSPCGRA